MFSALDLDSSLLIYLVNFKPAFHFINKNPLFFRLIAHRFGDSFLQNPETYLEKREVG